MKTSNPVQCQRRVANCALGLAATPILLSATPGQGQALPPVEYAPDGTAFRRGEVLIQFKADVSDQQLTGVFQQGRLGLIKHIQTPAMRARGRIGLTRAATALSVPEAVQLLKRLPGVEFVEPDYVATQEYAANDELYLGGVLWGMYSDGTDPLVGPVAYGSQADAAWAAGFIGSMDVYVGVIDGGIQLDHPDLAANLWTNPGEIPGNGIDDESNGYVDDLHGWNGADDNGNVSNVDDTDLHGSHVAGTIGAVGGNGIGVAGINWEVTIISGKGFGAGYYSDLIQAIDYMTSLKTSKGVNLVALNHSWGGTSYSQALSESISRAAQAGILSVVAALAPFTLTGGTLNVAGLMALDPIGLSVPAAPANVVATAASGSRVNVTWIDQSYDELGFAIERSSDGLIFVLADTVGAGYRNYSDRTVQPGNTYFYRVYAYNPGGGSSYANTATVSTPTVTLPSAPSSLKATALSLGRVSLTWNDNANNEDGFQIERKTGSSGAWQLVATVSANTKSYTDTSTARRTTYSYGVRALNAAGVSAYSTLPLT